MKKIIIIVGIVLVLAVAVIMLLGRSSNSQFDTNKATDILDRRLMEMETVDSDNLENAYGLDLSKVSSYVVKRNAYGDLYAIIETENATLVDDDMQEYFEKLKKFDASYSPERLEILDNRVEKKIGNVLVYIIAENAAELYQEIIQDM